MLSERAKHQTYMVEFGFVRRKYDAACPWLCLCFDQTPRRSVGIDKLQLQGLIATLFVSHSALNVALGVTRPPQRV